MSYFLSADVTLSSKLLEVMYIVMGFIAIYAGLKNFKDKENPSRFGTALFWCSLGLVVSFGRWIPNLVNGILIFVMCAPAIMKKVKPGKSNAPSKAETQAKFEKIGLKIFAPALSIGLFALTFALFTDLNALVGLAFGVIVSVILLMLYSSENKPMVFLNDAERFLSIVGPTCMLPSLLAVLGSVFTQAGVGDVIAQLVGYIVPEGNVNVGIIVYAVGMMLFTMIMGNAFAAITVMTVGIGGPFVLAYGADPVLIGMLALTCGYCGTLCTPMAANFNIVPVAILEIKDKFAVIKQQVLPALIILTFQIVYMIMFK